LIAFIASSLNLNPSPPPSPLRDFVVIGKSGSSSEKRNRQTGEKALERKPLKGELQKPQHPENIALQAPWTLTHSLPKYSAF